MCEDGKLSNTFKKGISWFTQFYIWTWTGSYPGSGEVQQRLPGDSWENDAVQRRRHQLPLCTHTHTHSIRSAHVRPGRAQTGPWPRTLTSFLVGPVDEEVHGADLGDLLLLSVQPQHLLAAALHRLVLHHYRRPVVTAHRHMSGYRDYLIISPVFLRFHWLWIWFVF